MKINWNPIKMMVLLGGVVFLYVFASKRNAKREVMAPEIQFLGDNNLFITHSNVSKLLIQNRGAASSVAKETLDLNELEASLNANPMIKSAEVFLSVNGKFSAKIKQKKPIARVIGEQSYYIDSEGGCMPLSNNYTERVPMVTGVVSKKRLSTVFKIASVIKEDRFLRKNVVEVEQTKEGTIRLKLRQCDFVVHLGRLDYLEKKISNLKVFYAKAIKDKALKKYSKVNLQFENQVVCTKV